jgi:peptidoglycan/LPS O-acetylase OafA/YrhL
MPVVSRRPLEEAPGAVGHAVEANGLWLQEPPADEERLPRMNGRGVDPGTSDTGADEVTRAVAGRYLPALDGVRALAILGVIAYHLGYGWAGGGYLGVDLFFVLSGFLITSLLVEEMTSSGRIRLGAFWGRRARRLIPGLVTMLAALSVWVAFTKANGYLDLNQLRGDALSTILYTANWHLLFSKQSYFAQFTSLSPLQHTWSLAIEEQFYLLWPLVIVAIVRLGRPVPARSGPTRAAEAETGHRWEHWRRVGLSVTVIGCLASAGLMALLTLTGASENRIYYGTDTRAFDLLAGAALAMLVASRPEPGRRARRKLHRMSPLALAVLAVFWWRAGGASGPPKWMLYGGFLVCSLAAVALLADARQTNAGWLGKVLSFSPLRWIGRISYGLYLWHWPVIVELDGARTGLSGWQLSAARVGAMFGLAAASFYVVERPLRRARYSRLPLLARAGLVPTAMAASAAIAVVAMLPTTHSPSQNAPAVAVGNSSVPGSGGISTERPIALGFHPSPSSPLRILLLGDSVMNIQAPALEAAFAATGAAEVADHSFPGWGLTTDKSWRQDVASSIAQQYPRPQLVLATWSWDDNWALGNPASYTQALDEFVRIVLASGDGVRGLVFEQFPPVGPVMGQSTTGNLDAVLKARNLGIDAWNRVAEKVAASFPGRVMYFPVGSAVTVDGRFSAWLPPGNSTSVPRSTWVRARMVDNTHFCPAGDARYADAVLADVRSLYGLPAPSPDWSKGTWTEDPRFSQSTLSSTPCPDDHPPSSG